MTPAGFEHMARINNLETLKKRVIELKQRYDEIQSKFNALCDKLDIIAINESYLKEVSTHLTIYLSEMDLIEKKIKDITEIIQQITEEISN